MQRSDSTLCLRPGLCTITMVLSGKPDGLTFLSKTSPSYDNAYVFEINFHIAGFVPQATNKTRVKVTC